MKLFDGKTNRLCIDQYGEPIWARTRRELIEKAHAGSHVAKQYSDKRDGRTVWTGYVVGRRWFTIYQPVEIAV